MCPQGHPTRGAAGKRVGARSRDCRVSKKCDRSTTSSAREGWPIHGIAPTAAASKGTCGGPWSRGIAPAASSLMTNTGGFAVDGGLCSSGIAPAITFTATAGANSCASPHIHVRFGTNGFCKADGATVDNCGARTDGTASSAMAPDTVLCWVASPLAPASHRWLARGLRPRWVASPWAPAACRGHPRRALLSRSLPRAVPSIGKPTGALSSCPSVQ